MTKMTSGIVIPFQSLILIRLKFGDCFIRVDADFAKDHLEKTAKELKEETEGLKLAVDDTQKRMNKLKSTLYSKFGNSIQLEED